LLFILISSIASYDERTRSTRGLSNLTLKQKLASLIKTLQEACQNNIAGKQGESNMAFKNTLNEIKENLVMLDYQTIKFHRANAVKRRLIESDVRKKIKALTFNITFLDRMIDAIFVNQLPVAPPTTFSLELNEEERKGGGLDIAFAHEINKRMEVMDKQLEQLQKHHSDEQFLRQL
jgi:hypothetical protein